MENIDISKTGRAILRNKLLAKVLLRRLENLTPQEVAKGELEIMLDKGTKKLIFQIGSSVQSSENNKSNTPALKL